MSRFCGEIETAPKFQAIERWKERCLLGEQSLFGEGELWNAENIAYLKTYFVERPDLGADNFMTKLKNQLATVPVSAKKLCAEMTWVMLLCPSNIKPPSKRATIEEVYNWSGETFSPDEELYSDVVLSGFGSAGTAYNTARWRELAYFILLLEAFYQLPKSERNALMNNADQFATWLEGIEGTEQRQLRHMLLFMLFPDSYERVFGASDRKKIVAAFKGCAPIALSSYSAKQIDNELAAIRASQVKEYGTERLGWYLPPLRALWLNTAKKGVTSGGIIFPILQAFLEQAKTDNLATKNYPATHNGLTMRVSFGAGNQAHVPWIGFLAAGQSPTKGIYPVYLYYKAENLLVLARGVSATNKPEKEWQGDELVTVNDYFDDSQGKKPIRYGESYVFESYDLNDVLDEFQVEDDLERLLGEYNELVGDWAVKEPEPSYGEPETVPEETEEPLTLAEATQGVFLAKDKIENIIDLLNEKKNIVLQGPPGVGKTYISKRLAYALFGEKADERIELIQFHQSYSYEDFIQGYRPSDSGFELQDGVFYQFCEKAETNPDKPYVFIIDEINRGNLSKIFGELMMLVEADKRGADWAIPLTYSRDSSEKFHVPDNVYLIGLMNTADRSLSLVDYALRRRFAFINLAPEFSSEAFTRHLQSAGAGEGMISKVISKLNSLNERIENDVANLGPGFKIGHSFFCAPPANGSYDDYWFEKVVRYEIEPLLAEYWFDDPKMVERLVEELLA